MTSFAVEVLAGFVGEPKDPIGDYTVAIFSFWCQNAFVMEAVVIFVDDLVKEEIVSKNQWHIKMGIDLIFLEAIYLLGLESGFEIGDVGLVRDDDRAHWKKLWNLFDKRL